MSLGSLMGSLWAVQPHTGNILLYGAPVGLLLLAMVRAVL